MKRIAAVVGVCALLLATGCSDDSTPGSATASGPTDGHARMVRELAAVRERVVHDNRFLGDAEYLSLLRDHELLPGPPDRQIDRLVQIAVNLLKLGRPGEAIDRFEEAEALLPLVSERLRSRATLTVLFGKGLAFMRLGETSNCVDCHSAESCILPIRGDGRHAFTEGSRGAMAAFLRVLESPDLPRAVELKARWLLTIAAMTLGEYPDAVPEAHRIPTQLFQGGSDFPRFVDVAAGVGLDTFNLSGGAVIDDLDGDGRLDVLTSTWDYGGNMRLFRPTGSGAYEEHTEAAGLAGLTGGLNMVHADYDNDGDADVLVLRGAWFDVKGRHPNSLLRNDGAARFTDITFQAGLGDAHYPTQTGAWSDYDRDGDLDLYIGNEAGERHPFASNLFRNDLNDDGSRFVDVAVRAGVENMRYAKGVTWGDIDDDGHPDLYVSNYTDPNRLYRNVGDGTFEDIATSAGVVEPIDSFPTWFWDYDNDGALDLYVAAYVEDVSQNIASMLGLPHEGLSGRLYRGDGHGGFTDVTDAVGLDLLVTTMGAGFGDLDNDGWLDIYLGTGYPSYEALTPNVMYRNRRGERFEDVSIAGGFSHLQKGHAVVFADLDEDGDQDVFEQMGGAYLGDSFHDALYENPGHGNHWLRLLLVGETSNRSGIGAHVRADIVESGGPRSLHRTLPNTGSFGSAPLAHHLGLGEATRVESLTVHWPVSGTTQVFEDIEVDQIVEIREGDDVLRTVPSRPFTFR